MPKYRVDMQLSMDIEAASLEDAPNKVIDVFLAGDLKVPGYTGDHQPIVLSGPLAVYEIRGSQLFDRYGNPVPGTPTVPPED